MNRQELLQLIHRNQQQIDLLCANNTQLIEALLTSEAQEAVISLAQQTGETIARFRKRWSPEQRENFERTMELKAIGAGGEQPTVAEVRRIGRPLGSKNAPKTIEEEEEQRYDSLGRRITRGTFQAPNLGKRWSPQQHRKMKAIRDAKRKAGLGWTDKLPAKKKGGVPRDPKVAAAWKQKLRAANLAARARKAAAGLDYTSGKPIAKAQG